MKPPDFKCYGCGCTPCHNPGFCGITSRTLVEEMKKYQFEYMKAMKKSFIGRPMSTVSYKSMILDLSGPQFSSFGSIVFQAHKDYLTATLKFMNL